MNRPDATWARILIVDDQLPNVILLQRMLEQWGYEHVTVTTQSHEAANLCASVDPDLLLLDLQMPKPDGFELMEILTPRIVNAPRLPVLVLTADATTATRQRALSAGASDFLSKPLDPIEVRLRIANLLETRRLELEMLGQNQLLEARVAGRAGGRGDRVAAWHALRPRRGRRIRVARSRSPSRSHRAPVVGRADGRGNVPLVT